MALVSTFFQMFIVLGMYNFEWKPGLLYIVLTRRKCKRSMEVAKSSQNGTLTCMHPLYIECCFRREGYIFLVLLIQINSSNKIVHTDIKFMFLFRYSLFSGFITYRLLLISFAKSTANCDNPSPTTSI